MVITLKQFLSRVDKSLYNPVRVVLEIIIVTMASKEQKVLIVGPGFIGWNVLDLLVKENYKVTGFVRRKDHGAQIKNSGASEVVIGDLGDQALISEQAARHDIIIHTATADDLPSVEAVLDGIQKRADPAPRTVDPSLYGDLFGGDTGAVIGLNSRSRAARLRQLGWKAVEKDWRASYVEDELPEILREEGERKDFKGYKGRTMN